MRSTKGLPKLSSVYSVRSVARSKRRVPKDEAQPAANVPHASNECL